MTFVDQTDFGATGNCMSACIASLFNMRVTDVPNFFATHGQEPEAWWRGVREWLSRHNYGIMCLDVSESTTLDVYAGYFIVSGMSKRGVNHAVIYRDGVMIHDPHPDRTGVKPDTIDLIYPLFN
jgi:hypothetical protein